MTSNRVLIRNTEVQFEVANVPIILSQEVQMLVELKIKRFKIVERVGLADQLFDEEKSELRLNCDSIKDGLAEDATQEPVEMQMVGAEEHFGLWVREE